MQLTNHRNIPVEIHFPRRLSGTFGQTAQDFNYRDTGCNGAGYAVDQSSRFEPLADDLLLLPQDEQFLTDAVTALQHPGLTDQLVLHLDPSESKTLGVYGAGADANQWIQNGPRKDAMASIHVNTGCFQICVNMQCMPLASNYAYARSSP